jgi:hypothetical protein
MIDRDQNTWPSCTLSSGASPVRYQHSPDQEPGKREDTLGMLGSQEVGVSHSFVQILRRMVNTYALSREMQRA